MGSFLLWPTILANKKFVYWNTKNVLCDENKEKFNFDTSLKYYNYVKYEYVKKKFRQFIF